MEQEEFYPYGPIQTDDGSEITVYLEGITKEQEEMLEDGNDEWLLTEGGGNQPFYIPPEKIDHIEYWNSKTEETSELVYEEYRALICGEGQYLEDVDDYVARPFMDEKIKQAIDDAMGTEDWDGAIYRGEDYEYAAVFKDEVYHKTFSIRVTAFPV
ncbi:MAG: hypothetical protein NC218_02165 [Acetobacter sp.]|nr:hypothetical protein [Acetobacter sp.]